MGFGDDGFGFYFGSEGVYEDLETDWNCNVKKVFLWGTYTER